MPSARPCRGSRSVQRSPDCANGPGGGGAPLRDGRGACRRDGRSSAKRCGSPFGCLASRPRGSQTQRRWGPEWAPRAAARRLPPQWERWLGPAAAEGSLGDGGAAATRPEAPRTGKPGSPGTRRSPGTAGTPPSPPGELPLRITPRAERGPHPLSPAVPPLTDFPQCYHPNRLQGRPGRPLSADQRSSRPLH